jgi:hypothetical protein
MANGLYVAFKNAALGSGTQVDLDADTIKVILADSADYTVNLSTHDFVNDVAAGARVSTATLSGKAISGGAFDSTDPTFTAVSGDVSELLILYKDTGTESTSPLIAYYDTFSAGMPITPNGGNIVATVHASGWFAL